MREKLIKIVITLLREIRVLHTLEISQTELREKKCRYLKNKIHTLVIKISFR